MEGANLYDVFQKISKGDFQPLTADRFSPALRGAVQQLLAQDPLARPTAEQCWQQVQLVQEQLGAQQQQQKDQQGQQAGQQQVLLLQQRSSLGKQRPVSDAAGCCTVRFLAHLLFAVTTPATCTAWCSTGAPQMPLFFHSSLSCVTHGWCMLTSVQWQCLVSS